QPCDILVEAACRIAKLAAERSLGDESHPDLVADEHNCASGLPQRAAQCASLFVGLLAGEEQVRQPQSQTIDENRALGFGMRSDGRPERQRCLYRMPERAAP